MAPVAFLKTLGFVYHISARISLSSLVRLPGKSIMTIVSSHNSTSLDVSGRDMRAILEKARDGLVRRVEQAVVPRERCLRVEEDILPLSFLDWLEAQCYPSRYYWRDRSQRTEMAGIGEAHIIAPEGNAFVDAALRRIRESLPEQSRSARYYGGFRFHFHAENGRLWRNFKTCRFVAPLVELFRNGNVCHLACTLKGEEGRREALALLKQLRFDMPPSPASLPRFQERSDLPDRAAWCALVNQALADMATSDLEKVVLARETTFQGDSPVNPVSLAQALARCTRNVYLFCFQPGHGRAFLGASPERLYSRSGIFLQSEALAGTRRRDTVPDEDLALERTLFADEKERREHEIVVETIKSALAPFCSRLSVPSTPDIVKLNYCQHLITPMEGALQPGVEDEELLTALHPTPAVGGKPAAAAMRWILEKEPFERGIYASPVGWVGTEDAEFCVGIRSGLVLDTSLILYAGAGIVPGSDPEEEWQELDAKMAQFTRIIIKDGAHGNA